MIIKRAGYICIGLMAVFSTTYASILAVSPLPLLYIDRNRSGLVSIGEALNSIDIDKRKVTGQPDCIEYFWLKDGLTAYISCPKSIK